VRAGVNAGVQLLNLTRMRAAGTTEAFARLAADGIEKKATLFGHLGDQDIWNYHFIHELGVVYRLPCRCPPRRAPRGHAACPRGEGDEAVRRLVAGSQALSPRAHGRTGAAGICSWQGSGTGCRRTACP
jgi:hypothetical protein